MCLALALRQRGYIKIVPTHSISGAYDKARSLDMLKRDTRWTLVFTDFKSNNFDLTKLAENTNFLQLNERSCCAVLNQNNGESSFLL